MSEAAATPLRFYVDADVLTAGAASASEHSASRVLLTLSEITLANAVTSERAVEECRRNLAAKFQEADRVIRRFETLMERSLDRVNNPSRATVVRYREHADWKDVSHLACAVEHGCSHLITYNVRDYRPEELPVEVVRPGLLVRRIRLRLAGM